jgi:hypothetical protein
LAAVERDFPFRSVGGRWWLVCFFLGVQYDFDVCCGIKLVFGGISWASQAERE